MSKRATFSFLCIFTILWGIGLYECTRAATISTWTHDETSGEYSYHYELPGEIGGRGLSNVAITIPCFEAILGVTANVPFRLDARDQLNQLLVEGFPDDLPETFTVTLFSLSPPVESFIDLKAGQNRETFPAYVPDCNGLDPIELGIPEPDTVLFSALGLSFIFLRRNRTNPKV